MKWRQNLSLSIKLMARARLRTILSSTSMAIGIAAMTILIGVSSGAEKAFQQALEAMGKNLLSVGAERKESGALRGRSERYKTLTLADSIAIKNNISTVVRTAPIAMNSFNMSYKGKLVSMTAIGTTPDFQFTNNQLLSAGRFIEDFDVAGLRRVTVIGSEVSKQLFFGEQPLGEILQVGGVPFIIIGVLAEKGVDFTGSVQDERILVPITTAQRRLLNIDYVDRIFVQSESKESISATIVAVDELLRLRHLLDENTASDFTVRDQASLLATLRATDNTLEQFLTGIAVLTLTLASFGLLAVSLLSVSERQSEIGLRLAVGARPMQVLFQFLSEAVLIAFLGALTGLLVGVIGIMIVESLLAWQLVFTWMSIVYTFGISLTLSLVFGVYPAMRAAKLDPIIALKSS